MTIDRPVDEIINDLLQYYDVQGPRGSELLPVRTTLLVCVKQIEKHDQGIILVVDQYAAEGFGIHSFWKSHMNVPEDTKVAENVRISWNDDELPPCGEMIWLRQILDLGSFPEEFTFDSESFWMPLHQVDAAPVIFHHFEVFAGGFGGWSMALRLAMNQLNKEAQSVALDADPQVARSFALTHHASFVQPNGMSPRHMIDAFSGNWIICADVLDSTWCPAVAKWGVDLATVSFPCQPWSGATDGPGLADPLGQTLFHSVLQLRFLRPQCIGFENVPGFHRHPHKSLLSRLLVMIGYRISWEATLDVRDHLGVLRSRWLALATRVNGPTMPLPLVPWPSPVHDIDHSMFVMQWTPGERMLVLTQQAWTLASDKQFLSWKMIKNLPSPQDVLGSRTYADHDILPTFMAMYGKQHELPMTHLSKHGYMAHFRKASAEWPYEVRYWHPAEIGMLHGALECLFIDGDYALAWKIMGNLITVLHAARVLIPAIENILGVECDREKFLQMFHERRIRAQTAETTHIPQGFFLTPMDTHPTQEFLDSVTALFNLQHDGDFWIPGFGIARFDGELVCLQFPGQERFAHEHTDQPCIEVESSPDATQPFDIMIKVLFNLGIPQRVDFSMGLPPTCVEQFWFGELQLLSNPPPSDSMDFQTRTNPDEFFHMFHDVTVPVIHQGTLQIFKAEHGIPLCSQDFVQALPQDLFDLFGPITMTQKPTDHSLLLDFRMKHGNLSEDLLQVFQNFPRVVTQFHWNCTEDAYELHLMGPKEFAMPVLNFWIKVLPHDMLSCLGRAMTVSSTHCGFLVRFVPARSVGVCPPKLFRFAVSIAAFRTFMDALPAPSDDHCLVVFKWLSRTLWEGELSLSLNVGIVLQFLKYALAPILQGSECRLVFKGKQIPFDAALHNVDWISMEDCNKITVIPAVAGGGPAKNQTRLCQQSAMAATMLEFGYELAWVSTTCEQLINKFNIAKIQNITNKTSSNARITAIIALCKEAGIDVPTPSRPTSRQQTGSTPWKQKKAKGDELLQPQDYQLVPGFFTNQDGTPVQQLQTVQPQTAGICMLLPNQAAPYLSGEQLSTDELGILVIGAIPPLIFTRLCSHAGILTTRWFWSRDILCNLVRDWSKFSVETPNRWKLKLAHCWHWQHTVVIGVIKTGSAWPRSRSHSSERFLPKLGWTPWSCPFGAKVCVVAKLQHLRTKRKPCKCTAVSPRTSSTVSWANQASMASMPLRSSRMEDLMPASESYGSQKMARLHPSRPWRLRTVWAWWKVRTRWAFDTIPMTMTRLGPWFALVKTNQLWSRGTSCTRQMAFPLALRTKWLLSGRRKLAGVVTLSGHWAQLHGCWGHRRAQLQVSPCLMPVQSCWDICHPETRAPCLLLLDPRSPVQPMRRFLIWVMTHGHNGRALSLPHPQLHQPHNEHWKDPLKPDWRHRMRRLPACSNLWTGSRNRRMPW